MTLPASARRLARRRQVAASCRAVLATRCPRCPAVSLSVESANAGDALVYGLSTGRTHRAFTAASPLHEAEASGRRHPLDTTTQTPCLPISSIDHRRRDGPRVLLMLWGHHERARCVLFLRRTMSLACISHASRGEIWRLQRPRAPSSPILPSSRCASSCGGPRNHSAGVCGLFVLVGRRRRTASSCPSSDFICTNSLSRERGFC